MGVNTKRTIEVKVNIKPAKLEECTPVQKQAWERFWQKLIYEVKAGEH